MSGIQRFIILFAIALTVSVTAYADTEACSSKHVEYKNAGNAVFNAFKDLVDITINNSSTDKKPYMVKFNQTLTQFLQNGFKYCAPNKTITRENYTNFVNVVEFSLRNATELTDLEKTGAFKCINNQKTLIEKCVMDKANETKHSSTYQRLFVKSDLDFNSLTCVHTENSKHCVLKVLEDKKCDKAINYVQSLFDFVLSNHCQNTHTSIPDASVKISGHWSIFIMVSLWSYMVLYRSQFN